MPPDNFDISFPYHSFTWRETRWQNLDFSTIFEEIPQITPPPPLYPASTREHAPTVVHPDYPPMSFGQLRSLVKEAIAAAPNNIDEMERLVIYIAQRQQAKRYNGEHNGLPDGRYLDESRNIIRLFFYRLTQVTYFSCRHHRTELLHPDITTFIDSNALCETALLDNYGTCDDCGSMVNREQIFYIREDENHLCHDCYRNNGYVYCRSCEEHTNSCEDCDNEDCSARDRQVDGLLHDYSTDVTEQLQSFLRTPREKRTKLFFGVELEVLPRRNVNPSEALKLCAGALEKHAIPKSDGSLDAGGFELVTVPATLAYHREILWNKFFGDNGQTTNYTPHNKDAPANKVKSWNTNCCGLHVHFSREALTPLQLAKFLVFIHADENNGFLTKLAGRDICPFNSRNGYHYTRPKKLDMMLGLHGGNREHHEAAGVSEHTDGKTVEVRIFKGNASRHGVMRALDFCAALIQFCAENSPRDYRLRTKGGKFGGMHRGLGYDAFLQWFNQPHVRGFYPDLWRQLIGLKYITTEHRFRAMTPEGNLMSVRICSELAEGETYQPFVEQEELAV